MPDDDVPDEVSLEVPEPLEVELVPGESVNGSLGELDRSDRIGRTALQVGIPAAIVGIGSWAARLAEVDLDPGAGVDLPADVSGYFVAVLAFVMAYRMNRKPKD